jgi:hypothetical protein
VQPGPVSFAPVAVESESAPSPRLRPTRDICNAQIPQTNSTSLKKVLAAAEWEQFLIIAEVHNERRLGEDLLLAFCGHSPV